MAEQQADTAGASAGGGKKNLLIFALVVVLAVGASVGGTLYFMGGAAESVEELPVASSKPAQAVYHTLRPAFVVNYVLAAKPRYLQTELTIMSRDPEVIEAVITHTPLLRSRILGYLTDYDFLSLQTHDGKLALSEGIRTLLNDELRAVARTEGIESVLFNNFVLQ
jgi:flagellar FliL protein